MKFDHLRLRSFRNYRSLELDFPPGVNVFVGPNGQGKTNLIEAIYYVLRGESFRPVSSDSLRTHGAEGAEPGMVIAAKLSQDRLTYDLELKLMAGKKTLLLNGHRVASANLAKKFPLVLFSPESLAAIKSGPEQRRDLIDDLLITNAPDSVKVIREFRRALRTRNRLLKEARDGLKPRAEVLRVLESLDPIYLPLACELTYARLQALKASHSEFQRAATAVLDDAPVDISVEYLISGANAEHWSRSDILTALHNRVVELREIEVSSGVSLVGPHKHDVRFLFAGKDSRFFCSQGQQRALILSFKMAQILYHYKAHQVFPFLLLDDVLSELDPVRRANLVGFLKDIPAQIFLTTTDLSFSTDFGDRRLTVFQISEGTVRIEESH